MSGALSQNKEKEEEGSEKCSCKQQRSQKDLEERVREGLRVA